MIFYTADYSDDDTRSPGDSQVLGEQDDEISKYSLAIVQR